MRPPCTKVQFQPPNLTPLCIQRATTAQSARTPKQHSLRWAPQEGWPPQHTLHTHMHASRLSEQTQLTRNNTPPANVPATTMSHPESCGQAVWSNPRSQSMQGDRGGHCSSRQGAQALVGEMLPAAGYACGLRGTEAIEVDASLVVLRHVSKRHVGKDCVVDDPN